MGEGLLPELGVPAGICGDTALRAREPGESRPQEAGAGQLVAAVDWQSGEGNSDLAPRQRRADSPAAHLLRDNRNQADHSR